MSSLAALSSLPQGTGFREDLRYGGSGEAREQAHAPPPEPAEPAQEPGLAQAPVELVPGPGQARAMAAGSGRT